MIYFYWLTGLGMAILLSVVVSTTLDNREAADSLSAPGGGRLRQRAARLSGRAPDGDERSLGARFRLRAGKPNPARALFPHRRLACDDHRYLGRVSALGRPFS